MSRLATAGRTVFAAALITMTAGLAIRGIVASMDPFTPYPGHTTAYGVARSRAVRAAMAEMAEKTEPQVVVMGSSSFARGFVPAVFDATLADEPCVSYNLAQMLFQPDSALAMATVLRQTYEARGKRIRLGLLGISVPELNRDSVAAARRAMPDQPFVFTNAELLAARAHVDPQGALQDGVGYLFFGAIRPERARLWGEYALEQHGLGCESGLKEPPDSEEGKRVLVDFCNELHREFPEGIAPWNRATRGRIEFGLPSTRPMLEHLIRLQSPAAYAAPSPPASRGPVPPQQIDEAVIATLVEAVRQIARISDVTLVVRDIANPAIRAAAPPEYVAQWSAIAKRIATEGGAELFDPNDGAVTAADFGDRTHLNPIAAERFSAHLAERLRPVLARARRASR